MKIKNIIWILGFLLSISIVSVGSVPTTSGVTVLDEFTDRVCTEDTCTTNLYSYQKYYLNSNQWQEINENFYNYNCLTNYDYCTSDNLYQAHMKNNLNSANSIKFVKDNYSIELQPISFGIGALSSLSPQNSLGNINSNLASFPNIFDNIDVKYTYLPRMFKEEIIIKYNYTIPPLTLNPLQEDLKIKFKININGLNIVTSQGTWNQLTPITTNNQITFTSNNIPVFYLIKPIAYDSNNKIVNLAYELSSLNNQIFLTIKVPYKFLINQSTIYPVTIDPTISLDSSSINWDGFIVWAINEFPQSWTRDSVSSTITIGSDVTADDFGLVEYRNRGAVEFNINSLPINANITNITLDLYINISGTPSNNLFQFHHMESNNTNYSNDNTGNEQFFNDMGNGTNYGSKDFNSVGLISVDLINAKNDMQTTRNSNIKWFSYGIRAPENITYNAIASKLSSSEYSDSNKRPKLTITYHFNPPKIDQVILRSTDGSNNTNQNLTIEIINATDPDNDIVYNVTDFRVNSTSIAALNMPFDTNINNITVNLIRDYSTYGNNATLGGGNPSKVPNWTSNCRIGGCYHFDGLDDFIDINNAASLNISDDLTVEAWVNQDISLDAYKRIIEKFYQTSWFFGTGNFGFMNGLSVWINNQEVANTSNNVFNNSEWSHVAFTYNKDLSKDNVKIYANGELKGAANYSQPIGSDNYGVRIGAYKVVGFEFHGKIDEVKIYNRSLSAEQIYQNYLAGNKSKNINLILSNELKANDIWQVAVIPNDLTTDGNTVLSNTITITVPIANEVGGDLAIEQGILNSLPNATIHAEKQVYTRHSNNLQQLGRFDRFTLNSTKRWAFNYITYGENFTNMVNLSSTLFVMEMTNLSSSQITQQVQQFILDTKNL